MHIFTPRLLPYTIFVLSYMAIFLGVALYSNNKEFLFYEGTMALIIALIVFMDQRVNFSPLVLCGLTFWGFIHLAGGLVPIPLEWTELTGGSAVLYDMRLHPLSPKYDQIVHAFGFGAALIAAHEALEVHFKQTIRLSFAYATTLFLIAMGLGALNELLEFAAVISIANTNVGGYENTGWDLVSNAVGALISLTYLNFRVKNSL